MFLQPNQYLKQITLYFHRVEAKPRVSLTTPNRDYFAQVSLTVLDAIAKAKKLFCQWLGGGDWELNSVQQKVNKAIVIWFSNQISEGRWAKASSD